MAIKPAPHNERQFSEAAWHRYRGVIIAYLNTHPKAYQFRPRNLQANTVNANIRDAVRGFLTFHYKDDIINPKQLQDIWEDTRVKQVGKTIVIFDNNFKEFCTMDFVDDTSFNFEYPSKLDVISILTLAQGNHFKNLKVVVSNCSDAVSNFLISDEVKLQFPNVIAHAVTRNTFNII